MPRVNAEHFGGNIVLTNDSVADRSPYRGMLKEISFGNFRYPGGGVTEDQTWKNGGLQRMFGAKMDPDDALAVMTIREALQLSVEMQVPMRIVIPTFQFFDQEQESFNRTGFNRYIDALKAALDDVPKAKIASFEIGNEFWAELTPEEYGFIANKEIPALRKLASHVAEGQADAPVLGLQAGAQWRATSVEESHAIASEISMTNRAAIGEIVQHTYPDAQRETMQWQMDWAVDPMKAFADIAGFSADLGYAMTEFNIARTAGPKAVFGVNQGGLWIEEFARCINAGVTAIDSWGINYKWLTNKFYDAKFAPGESDGGTIATKATPMGQVFDIASTYLVGKHTITDRSAIQGMDVSHGLGITGFAEDRQRLVFLSNMTERVKSINLDGLGKKHVSAHHLISADSPESDWYDESTLMLESLDRIIDARGDMKVTSGDALGDHITLGQNELIVLIISDNSKNLFLEGAHNQTDPANRMVNDVLVGANGHDLIYGHVGDDYLSGLGGKDRIFGGSGDDQIWGKLGKDRIAGQQGDDKIYGGLGNDRIWGGSGNDRVSGNRGDDSLAAGQGEDWLSGASGNDRISGGSGSDRIWGGSGNDRIWAGSGHDRVSGNQGDDWVSGGQGEDRLGGGSGNDRIWGGSGSDRIWGGSGNDFIWGGSGNDRIGGGSGHDRVSGSWGDDWISGEGGNDHIWGGSGDDWVAGRQGDDTVQGGAGADRLYGNGGHDRLFGRSGNDRLYGAGGDDTLQGGNGDDYLYAGAGRDHLWGGGGEDTFFVDPLQGTHIIHDFAIGQDRVILRGTDSDTDYTLSDGEHGAVLFSNGSRVVFLHLDADLFNGSDFTFT